MKLIRSIVCFLIFLLHSNATGQNIGFEQSAVGQYTSTNAIAGWTIESASSNQASCNTSYNWNQPITQCWIRQTPFITSFPFGNVNTSPLGGTKIVQLNSATGSTLVTRIRNTFTVSAMQNFLFYAFCGSFMDGGHSCCQQSFGKIKIYDCSGTLLGNYPLNINAVGPSCPTFASASFSVTSSYSWTNWQTRFIDLYAYMGSCITVEVEASDCVDGLHPGMMLFDAELGPSVISIDEVMSYLNPVVPVGYCLGSTQAVLNAPPGYSSYTWIAPGTGTIPAYMGGTAPSYTITNPLAGSVYTAVIVDPFGNYFTQTYTVTYSNVTINALGASSSCLNGTSGSATVLASGSSVLYNYSWINASNMVVGTGSVVSNLAPGIYSISVSAAGCGSTVSTVTVGTAPSGLNTVLKPYCGSEAYFSLNAYNIQWYYNSAPYTPTVAGSSFTIPVSAPNSIYTVAYNQQGCRDSVAFIMDNSIQSGNVSVSNNSVCAFSFTGGAVITMTHAVTGLPGINSFSVFSTGLTPAYSSTFSSSSINVFSLTGLPAGGTFSIAAFDGSCRYGSTFSMNVYSPAMFSVSPASSFSLCSGSAIVPSVQFNTQPPLNSYTYVWYASNGTFLGLSQGLLIMPTVPYGSSSTFVYSVVVTPTVINCPQTKTFSVTVSSPVTPSVSVPDFCANSPQYTVSASPPGGAFVNTLPYLDVSGVLTPSLAPVGYNGFTYIHSVGGCSASTNGGFYVHPLPVLSFGSSAWLVNGAFGVCAGNTVTLTVSAPNVNSYNWSNGVSGASLVITPIATQVYTVSGTNSYSCMSIEEVTVAVLPLPVLSFSSSAGLANGATSVCAGNALTLTVSAPNTYSYNWSSGIIGSSLVTTSFATSVYTVSGTDIYSCIGVGEITVTAVPLPLLSISGHTAMCFGESTTFSASGADSYTWSVLASGPDINVFPQVTTVYTVTGTNSITGCFTSQQFTLNVSHCTALDEWQMEAAPGLYPNPASDQVTIILQHQARLTLVDETGKVIAEKELDAGNNLLDLSHYAEGIYFVYLANAENTWHIKLLKTP